MKGLACPFCVSGIEKHIEKVEGVSEVSTNLKRGEFVLSYEPGSAFNLESINEAIVHGGFTPGPATVTATGSIKKQEERFVLEVTDSRSTFWLFEVEVVEGEDDTRDARPQILTEETAAVLEKAVEANQIIRIMGKVHRHKDSSFGLAVEKFEVVEAKEDAE